MKQATRILGACLSAALLSACGSNGSSFPSLTPVAMNGAHAVGQNAQLEKVLYGFTGTPDAASPYTGRLTNVRGTLYGTTSVGGANDLGAIFSVTTSGAESVVYSFSGNPDGKDPNGNLVSVGNTLYGTTTSGGANDSGTVFKLQCIVARCTESVLHSFGGTTDDGNSPSTDLTDVNGTLYGTTTQGGGSTNCLNGCGTVFKVTASGAYSRVYSFTGGSDGDAPYSGLIDVGGTRYGTTVGGGANDSGTVYKIAASGAESVIYRFAGSPDGQSPFARLTHVAGTLYGTTYGGGAKDRGTIYKITTSGTETVLYSFKGGRNDGERPGTAGLINVGAMLYGTTDEGGATTRGVIFALVKPSGPELVLHSFMGKTDGADPETGLTNVNGTLYGTTRRGGASDKGTVYSLSF